MNCYRCSHDPCDCDAMPFRRSMDVGVDNAFAEWGSWGPFPLEAV